MIPRVYFYFRSEEHNNEYTNLVQRVNGRVKHTNLYPDLKYIYTFVSSCDYYYISDDPKGVLRFLVRRTLIINTHVANDTWTF